MQFIVDHKVELVGAAVLIIDYAVMKIPSLKGNNLIDLLETFLKGLVKKDTPPAA